jgi:hypothetical protein
VKATTDFVSSVAIVRFLGAVSGFHARQQLGLGVCPTNPPTVYYVITPQAMRSPALPAGSDFRSSALAWITRAVPPFANTE